MSISDEEQPLLLPAGAVTPEDVVKHDGVLLDFEPFDPENPRNWAPSFKWFIVLLLAFMAFTVTFTCIGVVPVANKIIEDLDGKHASSSATALLVTIWELGEAAGPLLIAPLSELLGRYPVLNTCNFGFIAATIIAASSRSSGIFIVSRMLNGLCVSVAVLNPAIIGDLFESDQRGSAMSLIMLAPLLGGAIGPAIGGAVAQQFGWRYILIMAAGLAIICEVVLLTCFKETYKLSILRCRKAMLESDYFPSDADHNGSHKSLRKLAHAMTRPFVVLYGSRVLMLLSLFGGVAFCYFYVISTTLPLILTEVYGLTLAQTGIAFISFSIGSFLSVMVCNTFLDAIYIRLRGSSDKGKPEYRLPLCILGAFLLPLAITAYGWIAELRLPVWMLLTSVAVSGFTLLFVIIPISAYIVDACGMFSASAMTGIIVTRCLLSTFLPLGGTPLCERIGYGWGMTVFGALSLALAIFPILLLRHGEKWRQLSEYTRDA